uniref:Immunoglobulin domain-containing protein n=1 Tax=Serinus canaria TaxID=9135 RepID=A0A8C9NDL4_SERCA
ERILLLLPVGNTGLEPLGKDATVVPKFLSGTVGGSVSFQCHHDPQGTYERKYLCRWRAGSCQVLLDTEGFVLESHRGRARMSSSSRVLLGQLREEDAGWYWCGARSGHAELTAPLKLHKNKFRDKKTFGDGSGEGKHTIHNKTTVKQWPNKA